MLTRLLAAATAIALCSSCAPYDHAPGQGPHADTGKDCFFLSQVSGYTHGARDTVHVSVGPGRTYEFRTMGACPDLSHAEAIAFDQKGPGTICRGMDVDLLVPGSIGPQRCPVSMIRRLPEEHHGKAR